MVRSGAGAARRLPRRRPASRWTVDMRLVIAAVALLAFILGYRGLQDYLAQPAAAKMWGQGWKNTIFYDLQLYTFAAAPTASPGPFPVSLEIARFLAPFGTLLAALAALRLVLAEQVRRYHAAHAKGHAIVAGDSTIALTLARNLRNGEGRKVVLVSTSDNALTQARRYDILTVSGDPSDRATLSAAGVARAGELYACASRGSVNADIAVLAGQIAEGRKQPLSAYALIPGAELDVDLRARRIGVGAEPGLRLVFFALEDGAARKLLDEYPLTGDGGQPAHVVIIGFGPLGQAVLREIARRQLARHAGPPVGVFIRGVTAGDVAKATVAFPAIGYACSVTYDEELKLPDTAAYTVFICLDDEDDSLRESMEVARQVPGGRGHVVTCVRESAPFARTLAGYTRFLEDLRGKIGVFGIIEEACMPANIRDDAFVDQLARSIHEDYVAKSRARGETETTNPSTVSWERLPKDLREANIAQASGIGAKLEAINAVVVPESAVAPEFRFTDKEIEDLAELEHERWMRERLAQGWKYGDQRDNRRKLHPDLVEWADLPGAEQEKDRDSVRVIPDILHDAGYQILRVPPNPQPAG